MDYEDQRRCRTLDAGGFRRGGRLTLIFLCLSQSIEGGAATGQPTLGGMTWTQLSSDLIEEPTFGSSVALAGTQAVAAAPHSGANGEGSGIAYCFTFFDGTWKLAVPELVEPENARADESFGSAIAASASTLVAAATRADEGKGRVCIFDRVGERWVLDQCFGSSLADDESFGCAVSAGESWVAVASKRGVAVYQRTEKWALSDTLGIDLTSTDGACGSLSVAGDFVAASVLGQVNLFHYSGQGWKPLDSISSEEGAFGLSVALTQGWLFVSDPYASAYAGVVHVVSFDDTGFNRTASLNLAPEGTSGLFGTSMSASGSRLAVTEPFTDNGLVHIYELEGEQWKIVSTLHVDNVNEFGVSVAVDSKALIVGAGGDGRGGAFVFQQSLGQPCAKNSDCYSGYCSDGVCCNEPCSGACLSCLGEHTQASGGIDGACSPVDVGNDPYEDCEDGENVCNEIGVCDGAGSCQLAAQGTLCKVSTCSSVFVFDHEHYCDGAGVCAAGDSEVCHGVCAASGCSSQCESNEHCNAMLGYYCFEDECVSGARCKGESVAVAEDGVEHPCGDYKCRNGQCLGECLEDEDCALSAFCASKQCLAEGKCQKSSDCLFDEVCGADGNCEAAIEKGAATQWRCSLGRVSSAHNMWLFIVSASMVIGRLVQRRDMLAQVGK